MARLKEERGKFMWRPRVELLARARGAARSADQPLSNWISQAVAAYLRNWKDPLTGQAAEPVQAIVRWRSGWRKDQTCYVCGECGHDPQEAHPHAAPPSHEDRLRAELGIICG